jgi:N-acyl amino acid synthase of PEP-CTERM/exosortase system
MFWMHQLNPENEFSKHWELVPAMTSELREEVYRIRHKVYCAELGFEPANAEGREEDEHDEHSRHLLIRCMKTGAWAGCVRLVLRPDDQPETLLPSEKICGATAASGLDDASVLSWENIAEISRLALAREFRHARCAQHRDWIAPSDLCTSAHVGALYLRLALYLGAIAWAERLGIEALLFLTEPRLAARLRKFGFPFRQVGAPVEHRGTRVLSLAHIDDPVLRLPFYMRPLYRAIASEIDRALEIPYAVPQVHRFPRRHTQIGVAHSHAMAA